MQGTTLTYSVYSFYNRYIRKRIRANTREKILLLKLIEFERRSLYNMHMCLRM